MFHRLFFLLIPQLFNDIMLDTALSTNPRIFRQLFLDPRKFLRKHLQDSVIKIQRISFPDNCPFESESRNGLRPFEGEEGRGDYCSSRPIVREESFTARLCSPYYPVL